MTVVTAVEKVMAFRSIVVVAGGRGDPDTWSRALFLAGGGGRRRARSSSPAPSPPLAHLAQPCGFADIERADNRASCPPLVQPCAFLLTSSGLIVNSSVTTSQPK